MTAMMRDGGASRREPPPFRRAVVERVADLSPRMRRITFAGSELVGLEVPQPAASVRLLLPSTGALVLPRWTGNEFLLPGGDRPLIRTFTPRRLRTDPVELDLDIVVHGPHGASGWAESAAPGDPAAISGTGRGYEIDPDTDALLLFGDESAIPAIAQLLEWASVPVVAHVEVARPDARLDIPVEWHDRRGGDPPGAELLVALDGSDIPDGTRIWAAGEAAAMQRIRKHLAGRGIDRSRTTVRGYWKAGRPGPG